MPLRAVLIDWARLVEHQNLKEPLKELLLSLYQYKVTVADINAELLIPACDCLVIADCEETLQQARIRNAAVLGYQPPEHETGPPAYEAGRIYSQLDYLVEGFEEVDFYFLERIYQRFHQLPWTVIETERCCLREVTLEDLDDLYELYRPCEITRYMDGLYEDREKEEEYTRDYIRYMYRFYGYGLWVVIEKSSGHLIGRAGLGHLEVEGKTELELGYAIAVEKQRKGFATEVCQGILTYAGEALGASGIYCLIQKENEISIHLAEKLGFQWEKSVISNGKEMQRYSKILQFQ